MSSLARGRLSRSFFLQKLFCSFSFPALAQFIETFSWHASNFVPCSTCYPCSAQSGTAPVDSCGHGQETSAPNLHIGSLPTQMRLRARAVSNPLRLPSLRVPNSVNGCLAVDFMGKDERLA